MSEISHSQNQDNEDLDCPHYQISESKKLEGKEAPPCINSNCQDSMLHEKDEIPHPSKTMWADHSTWWRSGWVPDTHGPCPPPLRNSIFGGNWNLEQRQQSSHQHNVYNRTHHIENDKHCHSPSISHWGETHPQQYTEWRQQSSHQHHMHKSACHIEDDEHSHPLSQIVLVEGKPITKWIGDNDENTIIIIIIKTERKEKEGMSRRHSKN